MSRNLKISLGLVVFAVAAVIFAAATSGGDDEATDTAGSGGAALVREDSHRLSTGSTDVEFVEFLDFECEACGAAFPAIEQLRAEYGDQISFVVRHFPLHGNSEEAARAAEAAAAQDAFEDMYVRLFETQTEWGHQSSSQREVFFGFAEDLGLDMDDFAAVYDDPATLDKIERDQADGQALGVSGTPTFFLDGDKVDVQSFDELIQRFEQAISG